jgi:CheY-specific phosphatase CheX
MTLQKSEQRAVLDRMNRELPARFVRRVLASCVKEFFDAHGIACEICPERSAPAPIEHVEHVELGSIIGFRGTSVRGGLAFVAPMELISEILPVPRSVEHPDAQMRDWSAEIANQLVGRFKNKLSARSLDFDVGAPVCFTGKAIRFVFLPDAEGVSLCFRASSSSIHVHLDCSLEPQDDTRDAGDVRIVPEGEMLLF